VNNIKDYCVLDPDVYLSGHLPIAIRCRCEYPATLLVDDAVPKSKVKTTTLGPCRYIRLL